MKKIKLLLFVAGISLGLLASGQVPQMIDYQGMARDGSGTPIANSTISVRIAILDGPFPGTMNYMETHTPQTNSYGLFHLMIGAGTPTIGNFSAINWSTGDYLIRTEIRSQQFLSPFIQPVQVVAEAAHGFPILPIFITITASLELVQIRH